MKCSYCNTDLEILCLRNLIIYACPKLSVIKHPSAVYIPTYEYEKDDQSKPL